MVSPAFIFIALEILSLSVYVLTGAARDRLSADGEVDDGVEGVLLEVADDDAFDVALEVRDLEVLEPVPDLLEAVELGIRTLADLRHLALVQGGAPHPPGELLRPPRTRRQNGVGAGPRHLLIERLAHAVEPLKLVRGVPGGLRRISVSLWRTTDP